MNNFLKKIGPFRSLSFDKFYLGEIFSHFSDATFQFVLAAWVVATSINSGSSMAIIFFCFMLPQFILSPFAGIFVDRFSRKIVLALSCLFRALLIFVFAYSISHSIIAQSHLTLYILAFLTGCGAHFLYGKNGSIDEYRTYAGIKIRKRCKCTDRNICNSFRSLFS